MREKLFLRDNALARGQVDREDLSRKAGSKRDLSVLLSRVGVGKHRLARKHPAEHFTDTAAGGFHFENTVHPRHSSRFADKFFTSCQSA